MNCPPVRLPAPFQHAHIRFPLFRWQVFLFFTTASRRRYFVEQRLLRANLPLHLQRVPRRVLMRLQAIFQPSESEDGRSRGRSSR